ncbi:SCO2400 family protein [Streptomyces humi]|uniref:SCO2400 family protein n=1 Tax=Streptomyces humi TaxID=1428620 RepID=UPI0006288377|nr:hypothetical protein [Streptomyces humi]
MDYCTSCRRHLNGALVCPGCGAYAPDIAPRGDVAAPVTAGTAAWQAPAADTWRDGPDAYAEDSTESPDEGPGAAPVAPLGRAARRRQRARWKKNQRRAVVATAVALVGGGLTVASMDRHSADRAQAAAAPDTAPMGAVDGQATEPTPGASAPTGRHRAPDATPAARPVTSNAPHEQSAGVPKATPAHGTTAATPESVATAAARAQSGTSTGTTAGTSTGTSTGSGASAAPTQPAAAPTPTATATGGTPASTASPEPTATSPAHLCLLVLCID